MAEMSTQTYVPVVDGDADIAMTMDGEQMKVQAPGRLPMQRVYLWEGNPDPNKKDKGFRFTNKPYNPKEDGPEVSSQGGRLPTPKELQPGPNAVQYLEVGLVIGDNPAMYKPTAGNSKKDIKTDRHRRGKMPRAESAIRAFIPITENIPTQSKYYVGIKPTQGRLNPRCIDGEVIFFYPEFWQGVPTDVSKVERRVFINYQTKHLAAVNKPQAERATASSTVNNTEKWTRSNSLVVTPPENLANTLALQYTMFQATGDRSDLRNMLSYITNATSDLKYGPHTASVGVKAFFDFSEDLSVVEAQLVIRELKTAVPAMPDLAIDLVQAVHRILKEGNHGMRLPYKELAFFLGICNNNIPSLGIGQTVVEQEVERALQTVHLHDTYTTGRATSNVEPLTHENYRLVLGCTKDAIDQLAEFLRDSSRQVAEQHGGILKHAGIRELMNKVGGAADDVHLKSLFEQAAGLHAVQHTAANGEAVEQLEQLSEQLNKVHSVSK